MQLQQEPPSKILRHQKQQAAPFIIIQTPGLPTIHKKAFLLALEVFARAIRIAVKDSDLNQPTSMRNIDVVTAKKPKQNLAPFPKTAGSTVYYNLDTSVANYT